MVVATPCLKWGPHGFSLNDGVSVPRTAWLGSMSSELRRRRSFEYKARQSAHCPIRRACSASFDSSSDEEFSRRIQELTLKFGGSDERDDGFSEFYREIAATEGDIIKELPDWNPACIEMKANSAEIPVSLRMIKHKKKKEEDAAAQWAASVVGVGESAYCSVKKAFSSMVFMIRELHSCTLQMREVLFYEDLQGILSRVQQEMHASFVWLFQQVFSHTPTLMVYVMILLANFTVHSMSSSSAFASVAPPTVASVEEREIGGGTMDVFDSLLTSKSFSITSSSNGGKTTSVGGNGGGNKFKVVGSGMEGDGWVNKSGSIHRPVLPDGVSPFRTREQDSASVSGQEELLLWNNMVDEASKETSDIEGLDHETMQNFVSPVITKLDEDVKAEDYFRTELLYQTELAQEPNNVLLLANYAQFLYLVVHDYDRAEEYFKRAIGVEPKDAEAHSKYAHFLWQVRKDLWAAEETFLEAISADPSNSFYAANYAHFLWNTGGEDTCFPLDSDGNKALDA